MILSLLLGTPKNAEVTSNSAFFWAPEKAGVKLPLLIFSPLLGSPENVL